MKLDITADFSFSDLDQWINEDLNNWFDAQANAMFIKGKELVDKARAKTREDGGFGNITWNLRSSIGCVLVKNHIILPEYIYFPQIGKGDRGHVTGVNYAREIATLEDDGDIYLIFVAGMEYASLVQAKGKDVIKHVIGDNIADSLKSIM